ncbi:citrate synthase [Candidatus Hydrogenedentota bacterium]
MVDEKANREKRRAQRRDLDRRMFARLSDKAIANGGIDQAKFAQYGVKRGLRNEDGSGVLVGLTKISTVIGYEMIDADLTPMEGRLEYRGHDVSTLVDNYGEEDRFGFAEVSYLLLFGELPKKAKLVEFEKTLARCRRLPRNFNRDVLMTFRTKDLMNMLARSVLALYSFDPDPDDTSVKNVVRQAMHLIAKFPVIVAYSHAAIRQAYYGDTLVIHPPRRDLSDAENFLYMMRHDGKFTKEEARALDIALLLHADHGGGNNSTFTTRCVSSSGTDTYSAIAAGIGSLKGPLHGGANKSVMDMLANIRGHVRNPLDKDKLAAYIKSLIKKEAGDGSGKIYGFGHAVYTLSDPRAIILKEYSRTLIKDKKMERRLKVLELMEEIVPEVFAKVKRSEKVISANVDFYSGFVYETLGIPPVVYTPIFAMARIPGWMAHRIEELIVTGRIIRPACKSVAKPARYVPLDKRK